MLVDNCRAGVDKRDGKQGRPGAAGEAAFLLNVRAGFVRRNGRVAHGNSGVIHEKPGVIHECIWGEGEVR